MLMEQSLESLEQFFFFFAATQGLEENLLPERRSVLCLICLNNLPSSSSFVISSCSELGNFAAVPCKSILHSSPRAYGNSRGIVTHPRVAELLSSTDVLRQKREVGIQEALEEVGMGCWCCFFFWAPYTELPTFPACLI